jgi:hypothetical protein
MDCGFMQTSTNGYLGAMEAFAFQDALGAPASFRGRFAFLS